ncbi:hypothetical protein YI89_004617 [Salmonella enterica subsp. enterica]|uniref:DUF7716 domain-containing protein n=1 Tax=Salmonella enterica TaxID=28901 RepID=UPI001D07EFDE|nr:hypothetical protein [Salmonella enterica]EDW6546221.1 hypothetical protein [Salmonella enterica subsp. enterica]EEJ7234990.1 hypothetical protein [Salmonella enterica subsp. salamae]EGZ4337118.1 hypothetical protein [Salmonella enterica subsp. enterica serovar Texas]MCB7133070.1 hypothetical protein [Salmonella enterica subsp. enterica serovar Hillegersberg]HED5893929.1 hypothetical protein [Salmonella enterica]
MRIIKGFDDLLSETKTFPDVGWLYVDKDFNLQSQLDIESKNYYLAEDRDESFDMADNDKIKTFLEAPTFCDIIDNKFNHHPNANRDELLEAVIYYIEEDDFLD